MFGIKRLDTFMLQRFLPLLLMTFFIVLFIVLMQFLFRMIDDLVGKGLGFDVLGELFFYAALTMVPTALPLAVLLASLMVFGNLGEKLELHESCRNLAVPHHAPPDNPHGGHCGRGLFLPELRAAGRPVKDVDTNVFRPPENPRG